MKNKINPKHIFTVLSVLCALGAAASFFTNDIGIAVMILLPLCGFFAWFGLQWYGLIAVAAAGLISSVVGTLPYADCDTWSEWMSEILYALAGSPLYMFMGLVGFAAALLFAVGFGKQYAGKKGSRVFRPLAAAGAILIVVAELHAFMLFAGDPISYWQMRLTADAYVSEKYPDDGYVLDDFEYNFKNDTYIYYYLRKDVGFQPHLEIQVRSDKNLPVVRYFSSFRISESFSENYVERINP